MINTLTYFDNEKDLKELTGLTHEELWKHGFNLDDMDMGFVTDGLPVEETPCEWDENRTEFTIKYWMNNVPSFIGNLLSNWENYCVGYNIVEYNGKQYFTLHHA